MRQIGLRDDFLFAWQLRSAICARNESGRGANRDLRDKTGKTARDLAANDSVREKARQPVRCRYSPATYAATALSSSSDAAFMRSDMPGLLRRTRVRKSIMLFKM
jgi:hypothetical protein